MNSFSLAQNTYYDVLDIKPDATIQEVREAYLRAKSAYNRDSVALYSLITPEERDEALRNIEEAYIVLSDTDRRREYDKSHGLLNIAEEFFPDVEAAGKVVSIDRAPPMDTGDENEDLLIPPSTDFTRRKEDPKFFSRPGDLPALPPLPPLAAQTPPPGPPMTAPPTTPRVQTDVMSDLSSEREWPGSLLRKIREFQKVSVEEMAVATKISKTYIGALEDENFSKLPAGVYVRGFVTQLCRALKLPIEKVVPAYMSRYYQARPDQIR